MRRFSSWCLPAFMLFLAVTMVHGADICSDCGPCGDCCISCACGGGVMCTTSEPCSCSTFCNPCPRPSRTFAPRLQDSYEYVIRSIGENGAGNAGAPRIVNLHVVAPPLIAILERMSWVSEATFVVDVEVDLWAPVDGTWSELDWLIALLEIADLQGLAVTEEGDGVWFIEPATN